MKFEDNRYLIKINGMQNLSKTCRIAVCVKQVPEIGEARINPETGTLERSGVPLTINPLDVTALQIARFIKEEVEGEMVAFSMGPISSERVLRDAIAWGCQRGYLISDPRLAASDTYATSYILSKTLQKFGPWDIIVFGERAIDGDTGQVGPEVAAFLNLPVFSYVTEVMVEKETFSIKRMIERGWQIIKARPPFVLTVSRGKSAVRLPTLKDKIRAHETPIVKLDATALGIATSRVGLEGSPTWVQKVEKVQITRKGTVLRDQSPKTMALAFKKFLEERGLL